jgi:hypothetical protein
MLAKALMFTILAACAAPSGSAANPSTVANPGDKAPPERPDESADFFCCGSVDAPSKTGEDCVEKLPSRVAACSKVLKCPAGYTNDDGTVTCF